MTKHLSILIAVVALLMVSCKSSKNNPNPASDSYFPVTAGSTWNYADDLNGAIGNMTITMTGETSTINGKKYYTASITSSTKGSSTGYLYVAGHSYSARTDNSAIGSTVILQQGLMVELQLCDDSQPVGYSWNTTSTDNGTLGNFPTRTVNTIKEKNITLTINGQTYSNVIHTQADLQIDSGNGFQSIAVYDFYLAKGIGLIEVNSNVFTSFSEALSLTSYSIK